VPMETLGSVNVLHGAGSTLYGSDAVSGVVDFETAAPAAGPLLRLRGGGGSFGSTEQAALASWGGKRFSEVAAGGREFSDGFMADRDYRSEEASSETRFKSPLGESDMLLAGSDRRFGANNFYGDYASWERTKGWFAGINQQMNEKTQAVLAYLRTTRTTTSIQAGRARCGAATSSRGLVRQCSMEWRRTPTRSTAAISASTDAIARPATWTWRCVDGNAERSPPVCARSSSTVARRRRCLPSPGRFGCRRM